MKPALTIDLRMYRMSGIGRYLRSLMPHLVPLLAAERIRVIGDSADLVSEAWTEDSRVEVFKSCARAYSLEEQLLPLKGALSETGLLWVPHYNIPLLYRGKLAVTIHDVCHLALPESLGSPIKRTYAKMLFRGVARKAEEVFCVSAFTSGEVQRYLGISSDRITVTPLGLDAALKHIEGRHVESDERPFFLYVGNVKPSKNLKFLLKVFRQIMDRIPHRLVIVGKLGNMRTIDEGVEELAKELSDRVHLVGEVSDSALMQYYRGAEAFIFPSLYEGFGLPLLEAMSVGCPVLCASATSLPEVVGDAGLYFDPRNAQDLADKMIRIVTESSLRDELIQEGYLQVSKFSYSRCASQTADVLNSLWASHH